ncbi:hypothetical protein O6H91_02G088200 [Diphasiastrum complanatum]|uniref:Uncharacterized protein n=1 Tax=Diphasiastrum complanatum TaxID=34168 RepID=A0ACC2EI85_DIPCM|nr:hypothetical protein O6H91_02G088200 [Diphasiastrum complanatum]
MMAVVGRSPIRDSIARKLKELLAPSLLEIEDVSAQHAGHAGVQSGAAETHFNVKIVTSAFIGQSLVHRHRRVYEILQDELKGGVHALSIVAKTPSELEKPKS